MSTDKVKTPSTETQALTKSMNMGVPVVGTLNQPFNRSFYNQINFFKNKLVSANTPFFVTGPFCTILFTPHSIYLKESLSRFKLNASSFLLLLEGTIKSFTLK